ncbi:hypothetical protein CEXT_286441 [Caerostris extrusa]|uniref:Uncharacterized protein n=1 Tax=Caerostris extrusa TaxID=172846 RepID=A0AAV4S233_CAEEX|nr:hypothetical protein CEXT_286441 [Caerostris extrusa]
MGVRTVDKDSFSEGYGNPKNRRLVFFFPLPLDKSHTLRRPENRCPTRRSDAPGSTAYCDICKTNIYAALRHNSVER